MKVDEIKSIYKEILALPVMEYKRKISELMQFVRDFSDDDRNSVQKIIKQAEKKRQELILEISRVQKMMEIERKHSDCQYICGIDEVGRGPLAGPIMAGAVILPKDFVIPYLNDSKQVGKDLRYTLRDIIYEHAVTCAVGMATEKEIDEIGIQAANYNAMKRAVSMLSVRPDLLLIDAVHIPDIDIPQVSIIKGDTLSVSIAAASIIAKTERDRLMQEYDKMYPQYGFASNVGYGSAAHIEAIKTYGPCEIHRRSFIGNFVTEEPV